MDLRRLAQGEAWMSAGELEITRRMVKQLRKCFKAAGAAETPLLALRCDDIIVSFLLVRRLEEQLGAVGVPADAGGKTTLTLGAVVEAIGKARERMRKAMKDLEESCAKLGTPIDQGIAEVMQPILAKAQGVAEAALEKNGGDGNPPEAAGDKEGDG